jgi:amino acid transporter
VPAPVRENLPYRIKRRLLGRPLTTASLHTERLSRPLALGVLASVCISSSAYGTEEMLVVLLGVFGLLSFSLVLPITGVVLVILVLLTLSYRKVVTVYTRAGGSYVVARDHFGPRVAQIAAVALLIDYVVTVAVRTAAGKVAIASAIPSLGPYNLEITVGVVLLLAFGNLGGLREAERTFALPTYLFSVAKGGIIVAGTPAPGAASTPTAPPPTTPAQRLRPHQRETAEGGGPHDGQRAALSVRGVRPKRCPTKADVPGAVLRPNAHPGHLAGAAHPGPRHGRPVRR